MGTVLEANLDKGEAYQLNPDTQLSVERTNPFFNDYGEQTVPCPLPASDHNMRLLDYPTIFGLTSTTGTSVIRHIGFYKSVADFENATAITPIAAAPSHHAIYGLDGRRRTRLQRGPQIVDGRTVVKQ